VTVQRGPALVILFAACGAPPRPPPAAPSRPDARVEVATSTCGEAHETMVRIAAVLQAHDAAHGDLIVRVAGDAGTTLRLTVAHASGEVGLDRSFTLGPSDCASAPELLALSVDRFLSAFPEWAGPAPIVAAAPEPARWIDVTVRGAVSSIWVPLGVDGQLGGAIDVGGATHGLGGAVLVRASVPQAAGDGRFQQTAFLVGGAYRYRSGPWRLRGEARAGALLVRGSGFDVNDHDWLPWWEGAVFAGRAVGWGAVGVEVAASGLRDKAVTRDGLVSEDIPLFRVGLAGELGVVSRR